MHALLLIVPVALAPLVDDCKPFSLFNGKDLQGWEYVGGDPANWAAEDGILICKGKGGGWISTPAQYGNFQLSLEYRLEDGANSGVFLRAPREGRISSVGVEIQIIDEHSARYNDPKHPRFYDLKPYQRTGAVYGVQPPSRTATRPAGHWNRMSIRCVGSNCRVTINGQVVVDCDFADYPDKRKQHPGLMRDGGYIGLSSHNDRVEFRNVVLRAFPPAP